jgi:hypothetical protein
MENGELQRIGALLPMFDPNKDAPFPVYEVSQSDIESMPDVWHSMDKLYLLDPRFAVSHGRSIGQVPVYYENELKEGYRYKNEQHRLRGVMMATRWTREMGPNGNTENDVYLAAWKVNPFNVNGAKKLYRIPLHNGFDSGRPLYRHAQCVPLKYAVLSVNPPDATCVLVDEAGEKIEDMSLQKLLNPELLVSENNSAEDKAYIGYINKASLVFKGDTMNTPLNPLRYSDDGKEVLAYGVGSVGPIPLDQFAYVRQPPAFIKRWMTVKRSAAASSSSSSSAST